MKFPLMIHVPNPCPEQWENMSSVNGGRYCASCNICVTDFSQMNEREIGTYLQRTSGRTCGHFRWDQVTDGTTHSGWKYFFKWKSALALLLVGSVFMISCRRHVRGCAAYVGNDVRDEHKTEQKK